MPLPKLRIQKEKQLEWQFSQCPSEACTLLAQKQTAWIFGISERSQVSVSVVEGNLFLIFLVKFHPDLPSTPLHSHHPSTASFPLKLAVILTRTLNGGETTPVWSRKRALIHVASDQTCINLTKAKGQAADIMKLKWVGLGGEGNVIYSTSMRMRFS